jgi:hypothetical protein
VSEKWARPETAGTNAPNRFEGLPDTEATALVVRRQSALPAGGPSAFDRPARRRELGRRARSGAEERGGGGRDAKDEVASAISRCGAPANETTRDTRDMRGSRLLVGAGSGTASHVLRPAAPAAPAARPTCRRCRVLLGKMLSRKEQSQSLLVGPPLIGEAEKSDRRGRRDCEPSRIERPHQAGRQRREGAFEREP